MCGDSFSSRLHLVGRMWTDEDRPAFLGSNAAQGPPPIHPVLSRTRPRFGVGKFYGKYKCHGERRSMRECRCMPQRGINRFLREVHADAERCRDCRSACIGSGSRQFIPPVVPLFEIHRYKFEPLLHAKPSSVSRCRFHSCGPGRSTSNIFICEATSGMRCANVSSPAPLRIYLRFPI